MSNSVLSKRYAKAIFDLAVESKSIDRLEKDFTALRKLLLDSENLREAVQNPVISESERKSAMEFILKKIRVSGLVENFVGVLIENRRLGILKEVADAYFKMVKEHKGEVTAHVTSAAALAKKQIKEIEKILGASLGKTVKVEPGIDENIIGGVIVRIGSKMIDASILGGLEKLKTLSKQAIASS